MTFHLPEDHRVDDLGYYARMDGHQGTFLMPAQPPFKGRPHCIARKTEHFEHVSVSVGKNTRPKIETLHWLKLAFWTQDDVIFIVLPQTGSRADLKERHRAHLWRPIQPDVHTAVQAMLPEVVLR